MKIYKGWIYLYTNLINNKKYVGHTNDLKRRISEHNRCKCINTSLLEKAILKYGIENFKIEVIYCFCCSNLKITKTKLDDLEILYIAKYHTYVHDYPNEGYNLTKGGSNNIGFRHSDEAKKKMSKAKKGKHFTNDGSFKKGHIPWSKGKEMSDETKKKVSETKKNQWTDPKYREKLSKASKAYWATHESPCKGIKYSEERKRQMSLISKGKPNPKNSGSGNGMYGKPAPNRRPVIQLNENLEFVKEWPGAGVAEKELNITNITRACKNGKHAGGYYWKYKNEYK